MAASYTALAEVITAGSNWWLDLNEINQKNVNLGTSKGLVKQLRKDTQVKKKKINLQQYDSPEKNNLKKKKKWKKRETKEKKETISRRRATTIKQDKDTEVSTGFETVDIFGDLSNPNFRGRVRREVKSTKGRIRLKYHSNSVVLA